MLTSWFRIDSQTLERNSFRIAYHGNTVGSMAKPGYHIITLFEQFSLYKFLRSRWW